MYSIIYRRLYISCTLILLVSVSFAQSNFKLKYENSQLYAGIEVGSKGVKMSVLEIGKNAKKSGAFNVLKDTSVNTDFISFNPTAFAATVNGLSGLFLTALKEYNIPSDKIFTVVSSGVKSQAAKEDKTSWINNLADSFRTKINEPQRIVDVIDVAGEAKMSHLGIVPDSRRYSTFLIDIGSGNTKGGYFPNGNTNTLRLFQLSWGTKTIANATEKRCTDDKTITNYSKQLVRVISGEPNDEVIYAVNASGAYDMSDYIAVSGGIAWSVANLMYPELIDNSVVPVTYPEVVKFSERLSDDYASVSDEAIGKSITDPALDKTMIIKEVRRVNQVFDQRSLMAGTALLLKIMRQFEGIYEKKQFYLVKNGQVGWISAYVDQTINAQ